MNAEFAKVLASGLSNLRNNDTLILIMLLPYRGYISKV